MRHSKPTIILDIDPSGITVRPLRERDRYGEWARTGDWEVQLHNLTSSYVIAVTDDAGAQVVRELSTYEAPRSIPLWDR